MARSARLDLRPREFELLEYLMRHAGQVVTKDQIFHNVWRDNTDPTSKVVEL